MCGIFNYVKVEGTGMLETEVWDLLLLLVKDFAA
jgi:hypothetical protein